MYKQFIRAHDIFVADALSLHVRTRGQKRVLLNSDVEYGDQPASCRFWWDNFFPSDISVVVGVPTFFSLSDIFINGACSSFSPHLTFVAVPYSGESYCSCKLRWISNHDARRGTVSANTIASRHFCINCCWFVLSRWELLPTWKSGCDKLCCHSATTVAYSHGKRY